MMKMKKLMLLLMLMVAMPSTAQNTDNPFPKKGYKVKWIKRTPHGFESYTCTIRKFEDSDTIYYMTYSPHHLLYDLFPTRPAALLCMLQPDTPERGRDDC